MLIEGLFPNGYCGSFRNGTGPNNFGETFFRKQMLRELKGQELENPCVYCIERRCQRRHGNADREMYRALVKMAREAT